MNNKVCVLLSSYNGEHFISEQINSIINQKEVDVTLLIRDDGSTDSTVNIIEAFCKSNSCIKLIAGENIGYIKSFTSMVEYANSHYPEIEYFAFSDQDDIWYPYKLRNALEVLEKKQKQTPNLYASNSMKVNAKGKDIGLFLQKSPSFNRQNVLRMPILQGCAMVFNRKAVEMYANKPSGEVIHDRWMFMICYFFGEFLYDHTPQFAYRIHGGNAIGVAKSLSRKERICQSIKYWTTKVPEKIYHKANTQFIREFGHSLSCEDLQNLKILTSYKRSFKSKVKLAFSKGFMINPKAGLSQFLSHIIHVFFNKL